MSDDALHPTPEHHPENSEENLVVVALSPSQTFSKSLSLDLNQGSIALHTVQRVSEFNQQVDELGADGMILPARHPDVEIPELCLEAQRSASKKRPAVILLGLDKTHRELKKEVPGAFYLEIPYGRSEILEVVERACRRRRLVSLVDDSELVHKHTVPVLEEAGYDVVSSMDGLEGLRTIRSRRPDLVITDIEMPVKTGYELCQTIKEDPELHATPVIICSALGEAADMEKGFDAGADDYLVKPAMPEEILTRVRNLLAGIKLAGRETILVVEDSPPVRQMVSNGLSRQGFEVKTAKDGKEGFQKATTILPDLVITDYDMPRWTGFQLVYGLKKDPQTRDIPVMMLTARQSQRDQAQMRAAGLTAYLVKPFSVDKCVALAERLLAERRLKDYKKASQLYLSKGTAQAAEAQAATRNVGAERAEELHMSVLFSDICGFTTMSSRKTPSEVVALLNEYFDLLCSIIIEEGGDIDKFIGDAIMALFHDTEGRSSALSAVRAGLRMQKALKKWAEESQTPLTSRVGINTGPLVRGDIGSKHVRRDYTVIGDTVNRAQRFESQAPRGRVLVSHSTYQLCKDAVEAEEKRDLQLKGVSEPVTGYVVTHIIDKN